MIRIGPAGAPKTNPIPASQQQMNKRTQFTPTKIRETNPIYNPQYTVCSRCPPYRPLRNKRMDIVGLIGWRSLTSLKHLGEFGILECLNALGACPSADLFHLVAEWSAFGLLGEFKVARQGPADGLDDLQHVDFARGPCH